MPPGKQEFETAMSAKLFLQNVIDFKLFEKFKFAKNPWQAVIESVSWFFILVYSETAILVEYLWKIVSRVLKWFETLDLACEKILTFKYQQNQHQLRRKTKMQSAFQWPSLDLKTSFEEPKSVQFNVKSQKATKESRTKVKWKSFPVEMEDKSK